MPGRESESDLPLIDPQTHQAVSLASNDDLERLREAIASGRAKRADGAAIGRIDGAYLSQGRSVAYPVIDSIPHFIVAERIEIDGGL